MEDEMAIRRMNLRFDLENPLERRIYEYLEDYDGSRNQLVIEALNEYIENETDNETWLLGRIRRIVREELKNADFAFGDEKQNTDDNGASVLEDLELFG